MVPGADGRKFRHTGTPRMRIDGAERSIGWNGSSFDESKLPKPECRKFHIDAKEITFASNKGETIVQVQLHRAFKVKMVILGG